MLLAMTGLGCRSATPLPPSRFPYQSDISFRGFAQEALFGHATQRTHLFDDYTKGSYHVRPSQLAADLPEEARLYGLELTGLVVVGPYGPIWAYDVLTFVRTPTCMRVNWLLMPHARITVKRSGCIPHDAAAVWLADLESMAPVVDAYSPDQGDHCLLTFRPAGGGSLRRQTPFGCYASAEGPAIDRLEKSLAELLPKLEMTYSGYPPEDEAESTPGSGGSQLDSGVRRK